MQDQLALQIPWPPRELSPNDMSHRMVKWRKSRLYKHDCFLATRALGKTAKDTVTIDIVFHPPTDRRRDQDNLIASLKYGLDGVAKGLDLDDSQFVIGRVEVGEVVKPYGCVRLTLRS